MARAALVLIALACALPAGALAQQQQRRPLDATAPFWRQVSEPGLRRAQALLRQARRLRSEVERPAMYGVRTDPVVRLNAYENAIDRLQRAQRLSPRDPEIAYELGRCYGELADRRPAHPPTDRALVAESLSWLQRTQRLDPEYEADDVWFNIAIAHARLHDWDAAAHAYERSAELIFDEISHATIVANLAEMRMLAGDLHGAVRDYEQALQIARVSGVGTDLTHWGLAVALDRLGEHDEAIAHAWTAMSLRDNTMAALTLPSVFFEPAHELHYYQALGHLALAEHQPPDAREEHLLAAVASLMEFLERGGADGPFAASARHRLETTRALLTAAAPRGAAPAARSRRAGTAR